MLDRCAPRSGPEELAPLIVPKAPDSKKLERQVRLYGPQCVAETMAADGAKGFPLVASATKAPEGRRLTQELHQAIHDLEVRMRLAQTLDVEPARVQRMSREPIAA